MMEPECDTAAHADFAAFKGRHVLVTGHTGFKGAWLCLWLSRLGAKVTGIALPAEDWRGVFHAAGIENLVDHRIQDIARPGELNEIVEGLDADLIVHMAAQALVRPSYDDPVATYMTNVIGTAAVLDAARRMKSLKGVVVVTSDKCYENREWIWGYRECDPMGGADPYSSSKGCAELVAAAFRRSYFSGPGAPLVASARAGNVFGGGDWSRDRLIPDIVKAALAGEPVLIRNPGSIRPWQHVLEPLCGYLMLAARLLRGDAAFAEGWNFGPDNDGIVDVRRLARLMQNSWGGGKPDFQFAAESVGPHEAEILRLDSTKAKARLGWSPLLSIDGAVRLTVDWYKAQAGGKTDMRAFSEGQIDYFTALMAEKRQSGAERHPVATG